MAIQIKPATDNRILVFTPYNSEFVAQARRAGGQWNSANKAWVFPAEQTNAVRAICREVYGEDDQPQPESAKVRLRCTRYPGTPEDRTLQARYYDDEWPAQNSGLTLTLAGREVARAYSRDGGAKMGQNVVIVRGRIDSGGSQKNPRIEYSNDLVVDILRLPEAMARRMIAQSPAHFRIVADDGTELAEPGADNVVPLRPGAV